jgi:hypothetical protein
MDNTALDRQLLAQIMDIPEVAACGFSAREGLSGTGVTIFRGADYFGSWRASAGELIWMPANLSEEGRTVATVDEALRYSLLLILRNLETRSKPAARAMAG